MISQSAAAVDLNVDAGTFYVDTTNNRVGVGGKTDPDTPLHVIGTVTATTFAGSGASLTSIPNSALTNSSVTINSTAVSLGGSLTLTTANIAENTNLYYTDARADARIAAADTDDLSEGSSNLYYTDARVDARVSGGSLGNITTTGYIRGPATFTIDPAAHGDNSGTVVIAGNLQVDGTTTTINSTTLTVDDKNITLASGSANAAAASGAGFTVDIGSGTNPAITYDGTNDEWDFNKDVNVTGSIDVTSSASYGVTANRGFKSTADIPNFTLVESDASGQTWQINSTAAKLSFRDISRQQDRIVIDTAGKVGIGTSSPNFKLDISGADNSQLRLLGTDTNPTTIVMDYNSGGATGRIRIQNDDGDMKFTTNNGNVRQTILENGNIGIGTASPAAKLHISGNSDLGDADCMLIIDDVDGSAGSRIPAIMFRSNTGGSVTNQGRIRGTGHQGMTFSGSSALSNDLVVQAGKIGIGTTTPNQWASYTDSGATVFQVRDTSQRARVVINGGNGAHLDLVDYAGGANDKHMNMAVDGGILKFGSLNDAGSAWVNDNIMVMDLGSGNVGIGTTAPGRKLHLKDGQIKFQNTGSGGWAGLDFSMGNGTYDGYMGMLDSNGSFFIDVDSNGNDLVILQNGNVGIGTSSPTGSLHVTAKDSGGADVYIVAQNTTNNRISGYKILDEGGNIQGLWRYDNGGNYASLSVGTAAAPTTITLGESSTGISFTSTATSFNSGKVATIRGEVGGTGYGNLAFDTFQGGSGGGERMMIRYDGNVGIGTTAPTSILHIHGVAGNPAKLTLSEGGATSRIYATRNSDTNSDLRFQTEIGGTIADVMKINYSGELEIGNIAVASSTTAPLHVAKGSTDVQAIFGDNNSTIDDPSIRIIGRNTANNAIRYTFMGLDADANHGYIGYNAGAGGFVNALNFDTSGNVGIGTSGPAAKLQVSISDATNYSSTEASETNPVGTDALYLVNEETTSTNGKTSIFMRSTGSGGNATARITLKNERSGGGSLRFLFRDSAHTANMQEKMVMTSGGRLGISTDAPTARLHVKSGGTGNVFYVESSDGHHLGGFYQESDTRAAFNVRNASGSATINLDSGGNSWFTGGNVGIGTNAPSTQLHMRHASGPTLMMTRTNTSTSGEIGQIVFGNGDWDSSMARIVAIQDGTNDGAKIEFKTQFNATGTEQIRMVIKKDGLVGIGTDNPQDRLHVVHNSSVTNDTVNVLRVEATSSGTPAVGFGPSIDFRGERGAASSDHMGRIGFVADTMTSSRIDGAFIVETAIDGSPTEKMRISSVGNVHLNTGVDARIQLSTSGTGANSVSENSIYIRGNDDDLLLNAAGNGKIVFTENTHELMRMEPSGDWMVGNTVARVASHYNNQAGIGWRESDHHFEAATTDNRSAAEFGRNNANSGDVITIRQQGTSVGMIGTEGGDSLVIQSNGSTGSGLRFHPSGASIQPVRAGITIDDTISLGADTRRFKDLNLGGKILVGDNGDYEDTGDNFTGGIVFQTPNYTEYQWRWNGLDDHETNLYCGSYFMAEIVFTQHQTNSGVDINRHLLAKWANNHTHHELETIHDSGSTWSMTTSITATDHNLIATGASGSGAHGRLRIVENYGSGSYSFSTLMVRVYQGTLSNVTHTYG